MYCFPLSIDELINRILREFLLIDVNLRNAWYVKTQLILYCIWFISSKIQNKQRRAIVGLIEVLIYTIWSITEENILTAYKTVFAFVAGILYSQYESLLSLQLLNFLLRGSNCRHSPLKNISIEGRKYIFVNIYELIRCVFLYGCDIFLYRIDFKRFPTSRICMLFIRIISCLRYCTVFLIKMYFCEKSY